MDKLLKASSSDIHLFEKVSPKISGRGNKKDRNRSSQIWIFKKLSRVAKEKVVYQKVNFRDFLPKNIEEATKNRSKKKIRRCR